MCGPPCLHTPLEARAGRPERNRLYVLAHPGLATRQLCLVLTLPKGEGRDASENRAPEGAGGQAIGSALSGYATSCRTPWGWGWIREKGRSSLGPVTSALQLGPQKP